MTNEQLTKVRDALEHSSPFNVQWCTAKNEAIAILDAELAKPEPEQEPVVYWDGDRSVIPADDLSYIPNWTDYYPTPLYRHPAPQSAQPFCYVSVNAQGDVTSTVKRKDKWRKIPLYAAPPSREWVELEDDDVVEIADRCTDVFGLADLISEALRAKNTGEQA